MESTVNISDPAPQSGNISRAGNYIFEEEEVIIDCGDSDALDFVVEGEDAEMMDYALPSEDDGISHAIRDGRCKKM